MHVECAVCLQVFDTTDGPPMDIVGKWMPAEFPKVFLLTPKPIDRNDKVPSAAWVGAAGHAIGFMIGDLGRNCQRQHASSFRCRSFDCPEIRHKQRSGGWLRVTILPSPQFTTSAKTGKLSLSHVPSPTHV